MITQEEADRGLAARFYVSEVGWGMIRPIIYHECRAYSYVVLPCKKGSTMKRDTSPPATGVMEAMVHEIEMWSKIPKLKDYLKAMPKPPPQFRVRQNQKPDSRSAPTGAERANRERDRLAELWKQGK